MSQPRIHRFSPQRRQRVWLLQVCYDPAYVLHGSNPRDPDQTLGAE